MGVVPTCQGHQHGDEPDDQGRGRNPHQLHPGTHQRVVNEIPDQAEPEE